jgi:CRISPR-associated protein Csm5
MANYEIYSLKVSTLSPLHIGSGRELLHEYDYSIYNGQTWRLNDSAILEELLVENDAALAARLARTPPAQLLKEKDYLPNKPYFRYVLSGTPRSDIEGAQFREQIKNLDDQPYIPGSSFKGALRTAISWYGWDKKKLKAGVGDLYDAKGKLRPAKFVGQVYERQLFGQDPNKRGKDANYDLFRALQVSDSESVSRDQLILLNTQVLKHDGEPSVPVEVEAIRPHTTFILTIKLDTALFSNWAKKHGLKLQNSAWITNFAQAANEHSQARVESELKWFGNIPGTKRIASFYRERLRNPPTANQFIMQFGWGTGWENMTLGTRLQGDDEFMETIISNYGMANKGREAGSLFPSSRHLAVNVIEDPNTKEEAISLVYPMGWVLVEMTRRK